MRYHKTGKRMDQMHIFEKDEIIILQTPSKRLLVCRFFK